MAGDEAAAIDDKAALDQVTAMTGTDLSGCLVARTMTVAGETTVVPLRPDQAYIARDALARIIYVHLFEWIVKRVNTALAGGDGGSEGGKGAAGEGGARFVGLLDVFGFEFFGVNNSFEQLAINLANEKLQQFFLK